MKKLVLTFLVILSAQFAASQISRSVYGVQLGEERKSLVKRLTKEKIQFFDWPDFEGEEGSLSISSDEEFAGVSWLFKTIHFREDKVYYIDFIKRTKDENIADSLLDYFRMLAENLHTKYPYYVIDTKLEKVDNGANGLMYLCDGKTYITLVLEHRPLEESVLGLRYEDVEWKNLAPKVINQL